MADLWRWWPVTLTLLAACLCPHSTASPPRKISHFISQLEQLEEAEPALTPLGMLRALRAATNHSDELTHHFLGSGSSGAVMAADLLASLGRAMQHSVTELGREEGVVLTQDGTTVALAPVLLGLEAGLQAHTPGRVRGLYQVTLARSLALSFQQAHSSAQALAPAPALGPDGCWDSVSSPQVFTLSGPPSGPTEAQVNGGMDGLVLGLEVSEPAQRPARVSALLRSYYRPLLEGGLDSAPRLVSPRRRDNFREMVRTPLLQRQVVRSVALQRRLLGRAKMERGEKEELAAGVREGMKEFVHRYMECPAIIPRCQWAASPYRGSPTLLSLPLSFLFVHHTSTPSQPCLTFQACARDMRAMQRFHQDDRGWDDIGYSFVAGSDGYLYEGRGWLWQGAHTLGNNARGYGVAFIGDYSSSLPARSALDLVRDRLGACATGAGRLLPDYTLHGHRQLVSTSCPGNALYSEITGWEHFKEVQK